MPIAGYVYLWFPPGHSQGKALGALRGAGLPYERLDQEGAIRVELDEGGLPALAACLIAVLGGEELRDTQSLFSIKRTLPPFRAFPRVVPLNRLFAQAASSWLIDLLHEGRLTSLFQPIAHADAPERPFAHEALLRGIADDGATMARTMCRGI